MSVRALVAVELWRSDGVIINEGSAVEESFSRYDAEIRCHLGSVKE
jgi:hypothetical protein